VTKGASSFLRSDKVLSSPEISFGRAERTAALSSIVDLILAKALANSSAS